MSHTFLPENHRKAALSFAYLAALASKAGFSCEHGPYEDLDSVDANLRGGGSMRPQLDIQLKATSSPTWRADGLHFQLSRKNYDDLRAPRMVPILLAVMQLPENENDWLAHSTSELIIKKSVWWASLSGAPEVMTDSKTVIIPIAQHLDDRMLTELMSKAGRGELCM